MTATRYRLAVDAALAVGQEVVLEGNPAHYLGTVLRLAGGDVVSLFNRTQGEWQARIGEVRKRAIVLVVEQQLRLPSASRPQLTVCFAPIKGGRLETIIEKATELGAHVLQPVITQRTIVDRVNMERAEAIAREAAEQCERIEWPEIRPVVKLQAMLGSWPENIPLIYGDESGSSPSIIEGGMTPAFAAATPDNAKSRAWGILVGPEGGFTPEEFALLKRVPAAKGVSLGPRILRADTAVITLCALTLAAWGDWQERPRFAQ